ncbi:MAG: hypothetical protein K8S21_03760 [Gemmatimonadetes bacterium]|nr:hypothetical protein [Gemmatimonadota bacterium]
MSNAARQFEEAADELGKLDATCALAPGSVEIAFRLVACAGLIEPTRSAFNALAAAEAEPMHDALLAPGLMAWRDVLFAEEKRVRGGARLSTQRFATLAPPGNDELRERLDAIWREPGSNRSVLERAIDSAAWSPDVALGEASAALLLCAGGRTDRVRILPFASADPGERAAAISAHRDGEREAWTILALGTLALRARTARLAARLVIDASESEVVRLQSLGRAAITARSTLALLRRRFVTTIPALADDLGLSRPAANDAVERLVALGLAREVTGRARDRVFAYGAAVTMAGSLLVADVT